MLDDQLSAMEREGVGELEYRTVLARLVQRVQEARRLYERERERVSKRVGQ